jgi:hypothetical protein
MRISRGLLDEIKEAVNVAIDAGLSIPSGAIST